VVLSELSWTIAQVIGIPLFITLVFRDNKGYDFVVGITVAVLVILLEMAKDKAMQ
jgi:predicted membrane chloride channel (bestrophin family)